MEERDPGLSIITPGENNVDPLSNSTSTKMSEKARGKMRAVDTSNEEEVIDIADEELLGIAAAGVGPSGYVPTQEWVSSWQKGYVFFSLSPLSSLSSLSSLVLFSLHVPFAITINHTHSINTLKTPHHILPHVCLTACRSLRLRQTLANTPVSP